MLIIAGHILTDPSLAEALAADLRAGRERTRAEDGCLAYNFALDEASEGSVLVYERWRDQTSLDVHLATPEVADLMGGWVEKIQIAVKIYDIAGERDMGV
ncbi:MAG TPA: putative quinol monooxygenase [Sphingobium sp.]